MSEGVSMSTAPVSALGLPGGEGASLPGRRSAQAGSHLNLELVFSLVFSVVVKK